MADFQWDVRKAAINFEKHAVDFHEAATVFDDLESITYMDPDHSLSEDRYFTVGMSRLGRLLMVAHCDRDDDIRIISARKATPRERRHYEDSL